MLPTGSFLRAVLENDLMRAVGHADPESLAALKAICQFIYHELPGSCHGNPVKVQHWLEHDPYERTTQLWTPTT